MAMETGPYFEGFGREAGEGFIRGLLPGDKKSTNRTRRRPPSPGFPNLSEPSPGLAAAAPWSILHEPIPCLLGLEAEEEWLKCCRPAVTGRSP
jgi:hypothetical protein